MLEGVESIVSAGGDVGGSHAAVSTEGGGGRRSFVKSRFLRAVLNNMFRRTTGVARDGLPHIFEVDLYRVGDDFAGQILVKREKFFIIV